MKGRRKKRGREEWDWDAAMKWEHKCVYEEADAPARKP